MDAFLRDKNYSRDFKKLFLSFLKYSKPFKNTKKSVLYTKCNFRKVFSVFFCSVLEFCTNGCFSVSK